MIEQLKTIVYPFMKDKNTAIETSTVLRTDLGLNSFDFIELICAVEDEFDIEIPDKAIKDFVTVQDIIDYIELKTND